MLLAIPYLITIELSDRRYQYVRAKMARPADFEIGSIILMNELAEDSSKARQKYDDKVLSVHGTVLSDSTEFASPIGRFTKYPETRRIIALGPEFGNRTVECSFEGWEHEFFDVSDWQVVHIKGIAKISSNGDIVLTHCKIDGEIDSSPLIR